MLFSEVMGCCKTSNPLNIYYIFYIHFTFIVNRKYRKVFLTTDNKTLQLRFLFKWLLYKIVEFKYECFD